MSEFDFFNRKINVYVLAWVILISLLFSLIQFSMNQKLKKDISKVRKEMKHDYEQKIKERAKEIKKLRVENDFQRKNIHNLNIKVDSLEKVKNKIHIKYVDRKKDIKTMDSEQIKKYWNGEFN